MRRILLKYVRKAIATFSTKLNMMINIKREQLHSHSIMKIAHRGAAGECPENTFAAFERAVELGAEYIEIDVQLTKDNHIVVIHDFTIDRTTNGKGKVKDFTYNELQKFDAGSWFSPAFKGERIPLFKDVLTKYSGKIGLLIEFKKPSNYPGIEQLVAKEISNQLFNEEEIIVQSFDLQSLKKFQSFLPKIPIGLLINYPLHKKDITRFAKHIQYLNPKWTMVNQKLMKSLHEENLKTIVWTVNTYNELQHIKRWPIDGIVTNYLEIFDNEKS